MDSFNRRSSLYEALNRQPPSSSIMNSASSSSSRLASPAASSSALGRPPAAPAAPATPVAAKSTSAAAAPAANGGPAWSGADLQGPEPGADPQGSGLAGSGYPGLSQGLAYPGVLGYPYSNVYGSSQLGGAAPALASPYGTAGALGSFGSPYGSTTHFSSPYAGQFAGQYGPYGASQYGGQYGGLGDQLGLPKTRSSSVVGVAADAGAGAGASAGAGERDAFVSPAAIFWHYIDLNSQEQGPFNGVQMHEWLEYLLDSTMLRRHSDQFYVSFAVLKQVLGTEAPFVAQLTEAGWDQFIAKAQAASQAASQAEAGQAGQAGAAAGQAEADGGPAGGGGPAQAQNTSTAQGDALETKASDLTASLAGMKVSSKQAANPKSPSSSRRAPLAPVKGGTVADAGVVSAPASAPSAAGSASSSAGGGGGSAPGSGLGSAPGSAAGSAPGSASVSSSSSAPGSAPSAAVAAAATAAAAAAGATAGATASPQPGKKVVGKDSQAAETRRTEPAKAPSTDPWKKPVRSTQVKISDLKQQALDSQKKKLSESSGSRKSTQGRWMPLEQISAQIGADAGLPGAAAPAAPSYAAGATSPPPTWGKKTVTPARSLADIQREQQQQLLAQKARNGSSPAPAAAPPLGLRSPSANGSGDEPRSGRYSALEPAPRAAPAAAPSPSKPRSRAQAQPMSITARANMAKPADELVHWVRVSFKDLVKGVDAMELLDVFLSLGNTKAAKEFIAESIYEYSRSMDGRKFASDFLARKKIAEEAMGTSETWKDVMSRFNPNAVVEQDPSFKVVSKKRTQKIARPGDGI